MTSASALTPSKQGLVAMPEATSNHTITASRRRFLSQAAGVAAGGAALALATVSSTDCEAAPSASVAPPDADPIFALIARHRAEEQAYTDALVARDELYEAAPEDARRAQRVRIGMKDGKPHYVHSHAAIDERLEWAPDFAHTPEIRARLHDELDRDSAYIQAIEEEFGLAAAYERASELCDSCFELEWAIANTPPTSVAGLVALLRYINEVEDQGEEWPDSDVMGREGWHYQLRQTAARALEALREVV